MGEELSRSLRLLAERGEERGAHAVLEDARAEAASTEIVGRPTWRRGLAVALGTAVGMLVLVAATVLLLRPFGGEELPPATEAPIVPTTIPGGEATGPLNDVNDLALAPNGDLWAATAAGAVRWDVATGEFEIFHEGDGIPGRSVEEIEVAPDGTVWVVGDQGIGRYDGMWTVYSDADTPELAGQLGALVVDQEGVVWAAVASEPLARYDGEWTSVALPAGGVIGPDGLAVGDDGTLWAGTHENGIFSFDGSEWQLFTEVDGAPLRAWHIAVAPDGAVWAWDQGYFTGPDQEEYVPGVGFARYDGTDWVTYTVEDGLLSNDGEVVVAADGSVSVVHVDWGPDHEAIVRGVSRFDGGRWTTSTDVGDGPYGPLDAIAVDPDGALWMPSSNGIAGTAGTVFLVPEEVATPPAAAWMAVPDPEQAPIRMSTAIGDLAFTSMKPSPTRDFGYVAATPFGGVIPGEARLYWSEDYVTWHGTNLLRHQPRLTTDGEDLIGFGDGFTRYEWDGEGWVEGVPVDFRGVTQDIAFGPGGAVALVDSTIYFSNDGLNFQEAGFGPEPGDGAGLCSGTQPTFAGDGIGPILVTEAGYVILGSPDAAWDGRAAQLCEPLAWSSTDGDVWELRTPESPFGSRTAVWDVADFGGRFVAIGSSWDEPATKVWVSDDGIDWRAVEVPQLESILGVAGGELGWFLSGHRTTSSGDLIAADMWFSSDGVAWDGPYEGPAGLGWVYFRHEASVGTDTFVSVNGTHDGIVVGRLGE
ncbi:MAG: hypothetical protein QNJ77_02200 [Acidimicrobiia bacterium]|nr:hypothetical protein [Acidimicrobiia bacterium]